MTIDELNLWIVDTVSEGGHSFRDLLDCIVRNSAEVDDNLFLHSLLFLYVSGYIEIFQDFCSSSTRKLNREDSLASIENYLEIVDDNTKNRATHFLEITDNGWKYLTENGLTGQVR
jgi:hypothetical protein